MNIFSTLQTNEVYGTSFDLVITSKYWSHLFRFPAGL